MSKGWDNATLKKLKALTGKGLSTSEIGKRLGMSKNAVVGKLNRLGWNLKAGGGAAAAEKPAAPTKKAKTTAVKKAPVAEKAKAAVKKPAAEKSAPAKKAPAAKTIEKKKAETPKVVAPAAPKAAATRGGKSLNKSLAMHQRIIQHSLEMANLKPNQCRWPIGDPDSENFHFCGDTVFVGKPYCYEHCKQAYQFTPPKKK